ncbi:HlyD family efflux transporter periplasmic adaptor subunit [Vibrio profundi]|uniref:HlyD family efflux transporter periplasmic adaptor subunit n=1 Tax=Vibrio profundi TaxID=1774960 RepID=UPI003734CC8F
MKYRVLVVESPGIVIDKSKQGGDLVSAETTVITLSNQALNREYQLAELELKAVRADHNTLIYQLEEQALNLASEVELLDAELRTQQAELKAKQALEGQQVISQLEIQKAEMHFEQATIKSRVAKRKLASFNNTRAIKRQASELRLDKVKGLTAMKKKALSALQVNAGLDGVLQDPERSIDLGQWLPQGTVVGVVTSKEDMLAEMRINARLADALVMGMKVELQIGREAVFGEVVGVSPNVKDSQITFRVGNLSKQAMLARPDIEVTGEVVLFSVDNALTIAMPPHYHNSSEVQLYVKSTHGYQLRNVQVIQSNGKQLALGLGVSAGDTILLVDPADYNFSEQIQLEVSS